MPRFRLAAIVLSGALVAPSLALAAGASTAIAQTTSSSLSPTPPVPLPGPAPTPAPPAPAPAPVKPVPVSPVPSQPSGAARTRLPHTGMNLPLEILVATAFIAAGVALRRGQEVRRVRGYYMRPGVGSYQRR